MRITLSLVAFILLAACGGSAPPATSPSGASASSTSSSDSSAAPASSSSPSSSAQAGGKNGDAAQAKPTIDSQREPFMDSCMRKIKSPDYCECGWEQFRQVFKDADLSQPVGADDPRLVSLQEKTISACGSKLPEDQIKASFLTTCAAGDARKEPYCQCAWPALRKKLAASDFMTSFQGARFEDAKKAMVVACKGKFPADLAKNDFMTDCTKGEASHVKRCECAWTKLHAKYSIEAIVAGTIELDAVPGLKECK